MSKLCLGRIIMTQPLYCGKLDLKKAPQKPIGCDIGDMKSVQLLSDNASSDYIEHFRATPVSRMHSSLQTISKAGNSVRWSTEALSSMDDESTMWINKSDV